MATKVVHSGAEVKAVFKAELDRLLKRMIPLFTKNSALTATYIKTRLLTGGTSATKLKARTGRLRASTRGVKAKKNKDTIKAGVQFGTAYAGVHIGKQGETTTIRPKNKKFLTIPLPAAQTKSGVSRGSATDKTAYGETFIQKSKAGNLIIFGKRKGLRGKSAGKTAGSLVPLFVLVKSVRIRKRVSTKRIISFAKLKIFKDMQKEAVSG